MKISNKKSIFFDIYFYSVKHRKKFDDSIRNVILLKLPESEIIQAIDEIIEFYKLEVFFRGKLENSSVAKKISKFDQFAKKINCLIFN